MTTEQVAKVAFVTANEGVEEVELTSPWESVSGAGATPVHIATEAGKVQAFNHLDKAGVFEATLTTADADADDFIGLVLPGGVANADTIRSDEDAVRLVRQFFSEGKPVAVICHGSWLLVEADAVRSRRITSWPTLRTDLTNAGAAWVDEEVVVCTEARSTLVSSRKPDDLPAFEQAMRSAFGLA
jgi:protease I